jgi:hypothetical protein
MKSPIVKAMPYTSLTSTDESLIEHCVTAVITYCHLSLQKDCDVVGSFLSKGIVVFGLIDREGSEVTLEDLEEVAHTWDWSGLD